MNSILGISHERWHGMVLNLVWLTVLVVLAAGIHLVWPYRSWSWGLLLGGGAGGSAMILTAMAYRWWSR